MRILFYYQLTEDIGIPSYVDNNNIYVNCILKWIEYTPFFFISNMYDKTTQTIKLLFQKKQWYDD